MANNKNSTKDILDKIFKDPSIQYGLNEFGEVKPHQVLEIFEKEKEKFYIKCLKRNKDILLLNEEKNLAKPEEVIRQLWIYKLTKYYNYPLDRIDLEKDVRFGGEIHLKAADIMVYQKDKITPWIIIETKNPSVKTGLDQLKTYISSEGAPLGVWSNGIEKVVLYRPFPREFQTLRDLPRIDQEIEDVLEEKLTLDKLKTDYDLVKIIKILEELVLAGAGVDSFNEVFKLIYAKLYDEKEARKRKDGEVLFRQSKDPKIAYDNMNKLFQNAAREWPGIFSQYEKIELSPGHLSVCVPKLEEIQLLDGNLETIDAAFEYLLPDIAKGKKGQYFTPRYAIDMAVKMLKPKDGEYVVDPACGSGGFLIHAMQHVWRNMKFADKQAKVEYAANYLYGIDFDDKPTKISRAMMLIAGDGRSHIFKLNSLNPKEWQGDESEKLHARAELKKRLHQFEDYEENVYNQENFNFFDFDVLLTNPPFAGDMVEKTLLKEYELAKNEKTGKLRNKMERHILFIERALDMIRRGGRMAIVLPQGVLNNTNMEYVRNYLFDKARILAVVGLHGNTFKPHTGTKTSVLFLQKWGEEVGETLKDYPIFMAVSKKSGKNNSGDYVYKKDAAGSYIYDAKGRKVLDHDLDEIAEQFIKFAKDQKFSFWK